MNIITVKINGLEYNLKGEENEEYLHKVAIYVDKKIRGILDNNKKLSVSSAAILTAVNIADEFFKYKEEYINLEKELKASKTEEKKFIHEIEELKKQIQRLEIYNDELQSRTTTADAEREIEEKNKNIEELSGEIEAMKEAVSKYTEENKSLKAENKEMKFNNQSSKYKIMDLQNKLIENQIALAKERKNKNALINYDK
ncbi:cell division protein ZapA [Clostridium polynesiense]|uniref:cell division protein ZapA n=1 Tax=Clostridium polynesiense TaxID=1325933 RepID=UPI00058E9C0C|nr:cell division protein ZapA [Clostridium polynesiense]